MKEETREALEALRQALDVKVPLGDEPVAALSSLAAEAEAIAMRTFDGDPYASLVLHDAPAPAEMAVAAGVAQLVAFETDWWRHVAFYVDRTEDESGNHRVYIRDEESLPGRPETSLPSIAALARGWAKAAEGDTDVAWEGLVDDDWEEGPTSGSFVFETMIRGSLAAQWAMANVGAFLPSRPELAEEPLPVGADAPGRVLCLHALRVVRLSGELPLPEGLDLQALAPEHRAYLEHLEELELAFGGEEPPVVVTVSNTPGPLRKAASAWLERFEDAADGAGPDPMDPLAALLSELGGGAPADAEEEPEPTELTTFEKKLRVGVDEVLTQLEDAGDVELIRRDMLLDELTRVAADARSPKHLLKKLVYALVESEAVEEIYVSDDRLEDAFKKKLGL